MSDARPYNIKPFFLPFGEESLFCLLLEPAAGKPRAGILHLPPFAEEMHKSRRMAAVQARRFAEAGYAVLLVDLLGCGDSTGDFEDATWEAWLACAREAHGWLARAVEGPTVLWGLRLGAVLAAELSSQLPGVSGLILWQPVASGESFLNQFLRIRLAGEMLAPGQNKFGVKEMRGLLASGEAVEVGGYMLSPALALGIDRLRLARFAVPCPVHWFEVSPEPAGPLPASLKVIEEWTGAGTEVFPRAVAGDAFWISQEIVECPDLWLETSQALERIAP